MLILLIIAAIVYALGPEWNFSDSNKDKINKNY
jgi:hypothetical protein